MSTISGNGLSQKAQLRGNGLRKHAEVGRREASNAKSRKSLFHFSPENINKFEFCKKFWKKNMFRNPVLKLGQN